jgi:hypothetical protein
MTALSAPLTPADCDLRGYGFMPLDVVRLIDSDLFALSTGDEFKAAVALWCKSWLQLPAGSLPDDDRILAHLSSTGPGWRKLRQGALRGWFKCSDGRLYHHTVAEKAIEAWERRGEWMERQDNKNERQKRWRQRQKELSDQLREAGITPPKGASLETLEGLLRDAGVDDGVDKSASTKASTSPSTVDAGEMPKTGTGTGTYPLTPVGGDGRSDGKRYAFEGKTIRLLAKDLDQWRKSFHAVPDLLAELRGLDDWLQREDVADAQRKRWFHLVSKNLGRKHEEALAAKRSADAEHQAFLQRHPERQLSDDEARALMTPAEFDRWKARQAA